MLLKRYLSSGYSLMLFTIVITADYLNEKQAIKVR